MVINSKIGYVLQPIYQQQQQKFGLDVWLVLQPPPLVVPVLGLHNAPKQANKNIYTKQNNAKQTRKQRETQREREREKNNLEMTNFFLSFYFLNEVSLSNLVDPWV